MKKLIPTLSLSLVLVACQSLPSPNTGLKEMPTKETATPIRQTIQVGNYQIATQSVGKGSPIVVLHGRGYSKEMVKAVIDHYKERHQVISFDALGHGNSDKPAQFSLTDQSDVLKGVMAHYRLQKPMVIGFSMGSYISLLTAERYPDSMSCLVLIGTRGQAKSVSDPSKIFAPTTSQDAIAQFGQSVESDVVLTDKDRQATARSLADFELIANAHKVTIPTLVLTGEYDGLNPPSEGQKVANALPNARFYAIKNAGHIAFF